MEINTRETGWTRLLSNAFSKSGPPYKSTSSCFSMIKCCLRLLDRNCVLLGSRRREGGALLGPDGPLREEEVQELPRICPGRVEMIGLGNEIEYSIPT